MNNRILMLFLFSNIFLFSQVQHINLGQVDAVGQYIEVMNQFSPKNNPGTGTSIQLVWKSQDNIYLYGNDTNQYNYGSSSFWVYNLAIKQWKCIQDSNVDLNFGVKGVFNNTNTPGKRSKSITFVDANGNLYLLGGSYTSYSTSDVEYNDLWKYDIALEQWAWIGGYNDHDLGAAGSYGPIGVPSQDYFPSPRIYASPVLSSDGMIYIYGGYESTNSGADIFDLWKYNPNDNSWTLLFKPINNAQNVGIVGVENANNKPGVLSGYASWFYDNKLWFFGGTSSLSTCTECVQKKIWTYNLATNLWSCIKNPNTVDPIYGQQGVSDINNTPPSLFLLSNTAVYNNEVYFFGGFENGGDTNVLNKGSHNSLWKYNMNTNQWTWQKGKQLTNHPGFFGKKGIESSQNLPPTRLNSFLWRENNSIKMFGGKVLNRNSYTQEFWEYKIDTNNFIWIDGITTKFQYNDQASNYYYENLSTPLVSNIVIPTKVRWGEKGEKLWFIKTLNNQPFLGSSQLGGMFEYDIESATCYKIKSFATYPFNSGRYGQINVPNSLNIPPYRENPALWETDSKLYLMSGGGQDIYTYTYNDFWVFDKITKNWTWINGASNNGTPYSFYSNIGEANTNNYPKSRKKTQTWVDFEGNLWLFSGINSDGFYMNDFWKFDVANNVWILMGGNQNNITNNSPIHFTDTYPPFVVDAATWSHNDNLYFYGGTGIGGQIGSLNIGSLNDIWKYSISTNTWSLISGDRKRNINGNYGIKEYGFITNRPGSRNNFVTWDDDYGNLWLYGGIGRGEIGNSNYFLYDLWKFDLTLNLWIWMDGLNTQPLVSEPLFSAYNYYLPMVVSQYSFTFKGNNKHYLYKDQGSGLWEFDFNFYQKDYNIIEGTARFDDNNNCDTDDIVVPNLKLKINNSTENQFYTNLNGYYKIYTPQQSNTLDAIGFADDNSLFNINPTTSIINFDSFGETQSQNYCISPIGVHNDLEIIILPMSDAQPGFNNQYKLIYKNKGNTTISGTVSLSYDESINNYVTSSITPSSQNSGQLSWDYINLQPFESNSIFFTLTLNSPTENPPVNDNDVLTFTANIEPVNNDNNPIDNNFTFNQLVVNSYDPNDKICLQGNIVNTEVIGQYVTYKIRFENNGSANAKNVVLKDFINPDQFDINSVITLDASHDYRKTITSNYLEYNFDNINLPFDDEINDGYIVYKIKTKSTLAVGDTFSNSADIYFDYNAPIMTNNYTTTIQNLLGLNENESIKDIIAYPNPVKDLLSFKTEHNIMKVEVYDIAGRILSSKSVSENNINLSELKTGNYILKLHTENGLMNIKIMKE